MLVLKGQFPLSPLYHLLVLRPFASSPLKQRVCGKLVENNSPNATRRKQLVENKGRKTGRKLTRRMIIKCKLVEYLQVTHWDDSVLIII